MITEASVDGEGELLCDSSEELDLSQQTTCHGVLHLPTEVLFTIFRYLPAVDLPNVSLTCRQFCYVTDSYSSLWRRASTAGVWPCDRRAFSLLKRLASYDSVQALIKLCFAHIYKDVYNGVGCDGDGDEDEDVAAGNGGVSRIRQNADKALEYLMQLATVAPSAVPPLSWLLIRPPWPPFYTSCKSAIYASLVSMVADAEKTGKKLPDRILYSVGKTRQFCERMSSELLGQVVVADVQSPSYYFEKAAASGCSLAAAELLHEEERSQTPDVPKRMSLLRHFHRCVTSHQCPLQAQIDLCQRLVSCARNVVPDSLRYSFVRQCSLSSHGVDVMAALAQRNVNAATGVAVSPTLPLQSSSSTPTTKNGINRTMRCILVDWLLEVAHEKDFSPLVIHLAVRLVDSWLSRYGCTRQRLQLLGIACLLLVSRCFPAVNIITVNEASWMTDSSYSYVEVIRMMGEVVSRFEGSIRLDSVQDFLLIFSRLLPWTKTLLSLASYAADLTLLQAEFSSVPPSKLAACCLVLAQLSLPSQPCYHGKFENAIPKELVWPTLLEECSGYRLVDLLSTSRRILSHHLSCEDGHYTTLSQSRYYHNSLSPAFVIYSTSDHDNVAAIKLIRMDRFDDLSAEWISVAQAASVTSTTSSSADAATASTASGSSTSSSVARITVLTRASASTCTPTSISALTSLPSSLHSLPAGASGAGPSDPVIAGCQRRPSLPSASAFARLECTPPPSSLPTGSCPMLRASSLSAVASVNAEDWPSSPPFPFASTPATWTPNPVPLTVSAPSVSSPESALFSPRHAAITSVSSSATSISCASSFASASLACAGGPSLASYQPAEELHAPPTASLPELGMTSSALTGTVPMMSSHTGSASQVMSSTSPPPLLFKCPTITGHVSSRPPSPTSSFLPIQNVLSRRLSSERQSSSSSPSGPARMVIEAMASSSLHTPPARPTAPSSSSSSSSSFIPFSSSGSPALVTPTTSPSFPPSSSPPLKLSQHSSAALGCTGGGSSRVSGFPFAAQSLPRPVATPSMPLSARHSECNSDDGDDEDDGGYGFLPSGTRKRHVLAQQHRLSPGAKRQSLARPKASTSTCTGGSFGKEAVDSFTSTATSQYTASAPVPETSCATVCATERPVHSLASTPSAPTACSHSNAELKNVDHDWPTALNTTSCDAQLQPPVSMATSVRPDAVFRCGREVDGISFLHGFVRNGEGVADDDGGTLSPKDNAEEDEEDNAALVMPLFFSPTPSPPARLQPSSSSAPPVPASSHSELEPVVEHTSSRLIATRPPPSPCSPSALSTATPPSLRNSHGRVPEKVVSMAPCCHGSSAVVQGKRPFGRDLTNTSSPRCRHSKKGVQ